MSNYTKKALRTVYVIGIGLYAASCFIPEISRLGILSCSVGLFSLAILLAGQFISKRRPKARKQSPGQQKVSGFHQEQALDIMYGLDDGRRHYENLPPELRKKSIFGGKNI